jgi:uroporphyrinogen decarboxylase
MALNSKPLTGKERILKTLRFEEPDRVPHFEVMFELEDQAFGQKFPDRTEWDGCTKEKKQQLLDQCMEIYVKIVERFKWDALLTVWPWSDADGIRAARKVFTDDSIMIGSVIGQSSLSIEWMDDWVEFAVNLIEKPQVLHELARRRCDNALKTAQEMADAGADFIHIVNDIAFNAGPFVSPAQFREFILPYMQEQVAFIKDMGVIPFIHTDGNIMPILDDYISIGAACFQSVDPMAGMDIAEVKKRCYGKMALMGNVQCSLLQDGPKEALRQSAMYCLEHGAPGGGYIFGSSNTIFPGMPLENYDYMLQVFNEFNQRKGVKK